MVVPALTWVLLLVAAALCAIGFYKFVYFLSVGYGFAIAGGGITIGKPTHFEVNNGKF